MRINIENEKWEAQGSEKSYMFEAALETSKNRNDNVPSEIRARATSRG